MSEIARKLATIEIITNVIKHPNADALDLVAVRGWQCIAKKDEFKVGDHVVYFEIDSFLPVMPQFEFLRKSSFRSTQNLGDGFRIKTIKLRGEISQGLVIPVTEYPFIKGLPGDDVTEILGVKKWELPGTTFAGDIEGAFPSFIPKTDQERIQNLSIRDRDPYIHETFEVTTKLDGSSMTLFWNQGEFGVCSRNFKLKESEDSVFWRTVKKLGLEKFQFGINVALQGELVGPGVNKNNGKFPDHDFYVFDIYMIDEKRYMTPTERQGFMQGFHGVALKHVPILRYVAHFPSLEEALSIANSVKVNGVQGEGAVWKANRKAFSFKCISPNYLIANDE